MLSMIEPAFYSESCQGCTHYRICEMQQYSSRELVKLNSHIQVLEDNAQLKRLLECMANFCKFYSPRPIKLDEKDLNGAEK